MRSAARRIHQRGSPQDELLLQQSSRSSDQHAAATNSSDYDSVDEPKSWCHKCPRLPLPQAICALTVLAAAVGILIDTFTTGYVIGYIQSFLITLSRLNIWALSAAFFAAIVAAQALAVPTAILGTGGGFVYVKKIGIVSGVLASTAVTLAGSIAGACLAFWLGRHMLRDWAQKAFLQMPALGRLDAAIAAHSFRINLLLRLSPVTPDGAINYGMSVTRTELPEFVLAFVGLVPWLLLNSYIGGQLTDLSELKDRLQSTDTATLVQNLVGLLFLVGTCVIIYRYEQYCSFHVRNTLVVLCEILCFNCTLMGY
jgi:uncharacterized membrane protein YdjX (TVP38/TMEM64 family)